MNLATTLLLAALASNAPAAQTIAHDPCVVSALATLIASGHALRGEDEAAVFLVRGADGRLTAVRWPRRDFGRIQSFRGTIPPGTFAIAHTHPAAMPRPSRQDVAESIRLGLPIYVVSAWSVWVVDPASGAQVKVIADASWRRVSASAPTSSSGCTPVAAAATSPAAP